MIPGRMRSCHTAFQPGQTIGKDRGSSYTCDKLNARKSVITFWLAACKPV